MNHPRSLKTDISLLLIVLFTSTILIISYILISSWKTSANHIIADLQNEENSAILSEIEKFTEIPLSINEMTQLSIEHINIAAEPQRNAFFAGILRAADTSVYSFSYGTEHGEYYGARRNTKNDIEIMKSDASTSGNSQYYLVTGDLVASEIVGNFGQFDPRTRDWYKMAKEARRPVFSDVYKHFVMNDLAISASYPIYDKKGILQGVLGTHLTLSRINGYLQEITKDKNTSAYIVEESSGELIANSLGTPNFLLTSDGIMDRVTIDQIDDALIKEAYQLYKENGTGQLITENHQGRYVSLTRFKKDRLDWLIITAISEDAYQNEIRNSIYKSMLFSLIILAFVLLFWIKKVNRFLAPVYSLIQTTDQFSQGDFSQRAAVHRNDEIGKLAGIFNHMADELCKLVDNLEEKVRKRTSQLELLNQELTMAKESAEQAKEQLEQLVVTDFLTGLNNRRFLFEKIEEQTRIFKRSNKKFSIVLADIDHFKTVNDTYGHDCGDLVLKEVAHILRINSRETDVVSRWGGEEFLLLLPETERKEAFLLAERIRLAVEKAQFAYDAETLKITMTLGVAEYNETKTIDEIIKIADMAVYKGKQSGRNRVECGTTES